MTESKSKDIDEKRTQTVEHNHAHEHRGFTTFLMVREILVIVLLIAGIYAGDRYYNNKYTNVELQKLQLKVDNLEINLQEIALIWALEKQMEMQNQGQLFDPQNRFDFGQIEKSIKKKNNQEKTEE